MSNSGSKVHITKADIVNRLITQYGFSSYLEYNKFDGASYYYDVQCTHKELAFLPEDSYLDAGNIKRLLGLASQVDFNRIMPLEQLLEHYRSCRFDVIFFDPVHIRPGVDQALRALLGLLQPGGVLVVHDCNPERYELTTLRRRPGSWVGETFKAFALLRHFNRRQTLCVSEDFGVGLIWNHQLNLDYPLEFDLSYHDFSQDRFEYVGLIDYKTFLNKSAKSTIGEFFQQPPRQHEIRLEPRSFTYGGMKGKPESSCNNLVEAQLFWQCAQHPYAETQSCYFRWSLDGTPQTLRFNLPALSSTLHELRFDPADKSISLSLLSIRVRDMDENVIWEWNKDPNLLQDVRGMVVCHSCSAVPEIYLRSDSCDPRCTLALPMAVLAQIELGARLDIQLQALPDCVHQLLLLEQVGDSNRHQLADLPADILQHVAQIERRQHQMQEHMQQLDALRLHGAL